MHSWWMHVHLNMKYTLVNVILPFGGGDGCLSCCIILMHEAVRRHPRLDKMMSSLTWVLYTEKEQQQERCILPSLAKSRIRTGRGLSNIHLFKQEILKACTSRTHRHMYLKHYRITSHTNTTVPVF